MSIAAAPPIDTKTFTERNFLFAVRVTCLTMLISFLASWPSYLPGYRIFVKAPLISAFSSLPDAFDTIVFFTCCGLLVLLMFKPLLRAPIVGVLLCQALLIFGDVIRLQPFQYMFCTTLFIASITHNRKQAGLDAMRIMICGVYFWAGFHKINATFYQVVFPWFVQPLYNYHTHPGSVPVQMLAFAALIIAPFFEAAIGIMLLYPPLRYYASLMALIMLAVVLKCLGPFGHNWGIAVWPWNVWLFWMEYRLFFDEEYNDTSPFLLTNMTGLGKVIFFLFAIAPALAMFNLGYTYPGFKLYSGNTLNAEIIFPPEETLSKAPPMLAKSLHDHKLNIWDRWEVTLHYPAAYAYRNAAKGLCPYLDYPAKAVLQLLHPAPFYSTERPKENVPLCP